MASVITNRARYNTLAIVFRGASAPANFTLLLITSATAPTVDTNTFSEVTEIAAGNGYTSGGVTVNRNSTDFDTLTEDDTNDRALVQMKDFVFTASGGNLPGSGSGASYAVLCDANATLNSREIWASFDLGGARQVSDGQSLTIQNMEIRAA